MGEEGRERLRALGARVRALRVDAGLTGAELAARAAVGQPAVSKVETGRMVASPEVLGRIADALGADDDVRAGLLAELAQAQLEMGPRRRGSRWLVGDDDPVRGAAEVWSFQCSMMPTLVQTPEYARRVMATAWNVADDDAAKVVAARVERQSVLYSDDRSFVFVVTEGVLRTWSGGAPVMRAQLDRLAMVSTLDTVRLGIIPWGASLPAPPRQGFTGYDDQSVVLETFGEEHQVMDASQVGWYRRLLAQYEEAAAFGDAAAELIARVARDVEALPGM
jgi:transcriptional regulator with XRE-family HTH domain